MQSQQARMYKGSHCMHVTNSLQLSVGFLFYFKYFIQHTASSAAPQIPLCRWMVGLNPRTDATLALTVRRSYHLARSLSSHPPQLGYRSHPLGYISSTIILYRIIYSGMCS